MLAFTKFLTRSRFSPGLAAACLLAGLAVAPVSAQTTVTAGFQPASIGAGQLGQYRIQFQGAQQVPNFSVPAVPGLLMQETGSESNFSFGSAGISGSITKIFTVQAGKTGTYTVPEFTMQLNGSTVKIPAATLEVTDAPARPTASGRPTPRPGAPISGQAQPPDGSGVDLSAHVSRMDVYVGEKLPLDIVLTIRPDLITSEHPIHGFNQIGDAFEQVNIGGTPEQEAVDLNGYTYQRATWKTTMTPLKSGNQTLAFKMGIILPSNNLLERFMGGGESVDIQSKPLDFTVLPLPAEGRPANFTGGIGTFNVDEPALQASSLQVGVPMTYKLTVSGKGNFDRLQPPTLDLGPLWRAYKPKETFKADDSTGYTGTKTFEYVIMPLSEKITELPPPQFNYFNPETKSYVELPLKPLPLSIKAAPAGQAPSLPAVAAANGKPASRLMGPSPEPGPWQSVPMQPIFFSAWFWVAQAFPAALLAALVITRRHQLRLESDPAYARRRQSRRAARRSVDQARAAASAGRAAEFYAIAQRALQEAASYSPDWSNDEVAAAMIWPEFEAHLVARQFPDQTRAQAREIFEAGDALRFGGFTPDQATLTTAAANLERLVQQLLSDA